MLRYTDHMGLVISTRSAEAAARYAEGVQLLISGSPAAVGVLRGGLAADPSLGVLLVAIAVARFDAARADSFELDVLEHALATSSPATRRERQHIEVVLVALRGDLARARALGAEHLSEFPADVLIRHFVGQL
jgi:hypothetical protein